MDEEKLETLEELLEKHMIEYIHDFDQLVKYFDVNDLDDDDTPKITTEQKTLIIIDNQDFNETYMIDIVNKIIDEYQIGCSVIKFLYIDSILIKAKLLTPNVDLKSLDLKEIEKNELKASIIMINPIENTISIFREPILSTFDKKRIVKMMEVTKLLES